MTCDGLLDQAGQDQLLGAQQEGVAHGSAQDAPQHVAPVLVGGEHAVVDEHGARAGVLGQDAQADVGRARPARSARPVSDDATSMMGRSTSVSHTESTPCSEGEDPLQPGAGVDGRAGQRGAGAVGRLVVLHEDQVPELHEPLAGGVGQRAAVGAVLGAAVDVQLRARAARAGVAHLPEVVGVAEALDALQGHADRVVPDLLGLVVRGVHGDPDAGRRRSPRCSVTNSHAQGMAFSLK